MLVARAWRWLFDRALKLQLKLCEDAAGPGVSIRVLQPGSAAAAFQLSGGRRPFRTLSAFSAYLAGPEVYALEAVVRGAAVGYVAFEAKRTHLAVTMLFVAPPHRRRGVGRGLVRAVLAQSARFGGREVRAAVPDDNLPAQFLMRSCGLRARCVRGYFRKGEKDAYVFSPPDAPAASA